MIYISAGLLTYIIINHFLESYNRKEEMKYRNLLIRREQMLYTKAAQKMQDVKRPIYQAAIDKEVRNLRNEIETEYLIENAMVAK